MNRAALEAQAQELARDSSARKAERVLTHPLLVRRYRAITNPTAV